MLSPVLCLLLTASAAAPVTLSTDHVDAVDTEQVIMKVATPGMVHLQVQSEVGTTCTIVDHLRGPFASDGVVGKRSCDLHALLDAGIYKVRLHSPPASASTKAGKTATVPQATLSAAPYVDADVSRLLQPGQSTTMKLPPGQQLVRLLRVPRQQEVHFTVVGQSARVVHLWRDGAFIEEKRASNGTVTAETGRPRRRHDYSEVLDAGDYALVVYATAREPFTVGNDDDTVAIFYDAEPMDSSRTESITLPAWGFVSRSVPLNAAVAILSVDDAKEDVSLAARTDKPHKELPQVRSGARSCTVSANKAPRGCVVRSGDKDTLQQIYEIRGPAFAKVRLQVVPARDPITGGVVDAAKDSLNTSLSRADHLAVLALPADIDGPPLGCVLERTLKGKVVETIARDVATVGWTQAYRREFNSDGTSTSVWLEVEKPGLYGVATLGKRGSACEIFAVDGLGDRKRVGGGGGGESKKDCDERLPLPAGPIEVRLYGGTPGIETLRVGQVGLAALMGDDVESPHRGGCFFSSTIPANQPGHLSGPVSGTVRVRTSNAGDGLMGLFVLPDGLAEGSVTVSVDPARRVELPLVAGDPVDVLALAADRKKLRCTLDGAALPGCRVPAERGGRLVITLESAPRGVLQKPVLAVVARQPPPSKQTLEAAVARPPNLPTVGAGKTRWFNLDGTTSQSFLVDVPSAGLYDLQTEGLLATRCQVRTATSAALEKGDRNGRGRNCLLQAYLKPGRYRVDVEAVGQSKGRAGLTLVTRPATDLGAIANDDERFVEVGANVLARHTIAVREAGPVTVAVAAQKGSLRCRLDDDDGWPLLSVPHACNVQPTLESGRYSLTVLPMPVASRRSLRRGKAESGVVLSGDAVHALRLNSPATALLGDDGNDRFRFSVAADVDVGISLSPGLLGRLRPVVKGKAGEVLHTVPPAEGEVIGEACCDEGDYEGDYEGDHEGGDDGDEETRFSRRRQSSASLSRSMSNATVAQPLPPLVGVVRTLSAGTWELEVEHSRGDVGIHYTVGVAVRALMDDVAMTVSAPAVVELLAPRTRRAGLTRIKTRGSTDVACRLMNQHGALVASSQSSGDDWNCALALPLTAGERYRLFIDAEVLEPGPTTVDAAFLEGKSTGTLKEGDRFRLIGKVATATVAAEKDHVVDVDLVATDGRFSCAAFDDDGSLLDRHIDVERCGLLLSGGKGKDSDKAFTVMAWTADRPASVTAHIRQRDQRGLVGAFGLGGTVVDDVVAVADAPRSGRYETAPNLRCLSRAKRGAMVPCPVSVSVDTTSDGSQMLLGVLRGEKARTEFAENVAVVHPLRATAKAGGNDGGWDRRRLDETRAMERQQSPAQALHLVEVRARAGADATPGCVIAGGAHVQESDRCLAVSSPTKESELTLWTRPGGHADVSVLRRAVVVPEVGAVPTETVSITSPARYRLPESSFRAAVAIDAGSWAVLLDDDGKARDVCGPQRRAESSSTLQQCLFRGRGGSVVVAPAASSGVVRLDVLAFDAVEEPPRVLSTVREVVPRQRGLERLRIASAAAARGVWVEGPGVVRCWLLQDDGVKRSGCTATVDANHGATLMVEHSDRAWRAQLGAAGDLYGARLGPVMAQEGASTSLDANKTAILRGHLVRHRLDVKAAGVLRLRSTGGVCGLGRSKNLLVSEGLGSGCDVAVVVGPGSYWAAVRSFGGAPLSGTVAWSFDSAPTLAEGIGDEVVALPGEARLFKVPLKDDGELGVGIQVDAEVLRCTLLNSHNEVLARGCQLFGRYQRGTYVLRVENDEDGPPRRFRPVVFGLQGAKAAVPDTYLRDFFARVPRPADSGAHDDVDTTTSTASTASALEGETR